MVEAIPHVTFLDAFNIEAEIYIRDTSGVGLKEIWISDNFGRLVKEEHVEACQREVVVELERLPRSRLPLRIEGQLCAEPDSDGTPFLVDTPTLADLRTTDNSGALICRDDPTFRYCPPNPRCNEAVTILRNNRNSVLAQCGIVTRTRSTRDASAAAAAACAAAFAAVLATAVSAFGIPFVGAVVGAILLGVAAGLAYLAAVFGLQAFRAQQRLDQAMAELEKRRDDFTSAAEQVSRNCCRHCHDENLTQPECG